jgi:hypothetical protein
LPRIVWVLIKMYLLKSSQATWLVSCCCTSKCCLLYWKICSFWKMWTVPGWFSLKLKIKRNYRLFKVNDNRTELCINKISINVGHILDDVPFYLISIVLCADTWLKISLFIKKTEKHNYSQNPSLYKQAVFFIVFLILIPFSQL